jgi:hypothetical protein
LRRADGSRERATDDWLSAEAIHTCFQALDCFASLAMTEGREKMLTKSPHLFDDATKVTAGDSRWQGHTSPDYWAFVGPFGGCTAATILRALIDHPERAGDPTAMTVNYCAPVAEGAFDLDLRLVKANRSSQHWCVEMTQGNGEVSTLATAVFAERRGRTRRQATLAQSRSRKPCPTRKSPYLGSSSTIFALSRASRNTAAHPLHRRTPTQSCGSATMRHARSIFSR